MVKTYGLESEGPGFEGLHYHPLAICMTLAALSLRVLMYNMLTLIRLL